MRYRIRYVARYSRNHFALIVVTSQRAANYINRPDCTVFHAWFEVESERFVRSIERCIPMQRVKVTFLYYVRYWHFSVWHADQGVHLFSRI